MCTEKYYTVLSILILKEADHKEEIVAMKVILYTKEVCSLCEDALALLLMFQNDYPFELEERDIHTNDDWLGDYQLRIPVIEVNGKQIDCEEIGYEAIEQILAGNDRVG